MRWGIGCAATCSLALVAGCSSGGGSTAVGASSTPAPSTTGVTASAPVGTRPPATTPGSTPGTTDAKRPGSDEVEPPDLLTIASGAVLVSSTIGGEPAATKGIRVIDGSDSRIAFTVDTGGPAEFVFQLPAPTTFERFAVPGIKEAAGNATFFKTIVISGSSEGPTTGFTDLVAEDLPKAGAADSVGELVPTERKAVRWIKLRLEGAQLVEERHAPGSTNVEFTELVGNGTQEDVPLSTKFTGTWDFRFMDSAEKAGPTLELKQQGSVVSGCVTTVTLTGNVTGSVARLQGVDSKDGEESVYLFSISDTGELQGVESTNGGVFRARVGPPAPAGAPTPCSDAPVRSLACDSIVYVNFDVDSAIIRPDSEQAITDVYEGLKAEPKAITIVGHTSTEGPDAHNLDLSERRAQAVVDALVAKGLDGAKVTAQGKGETQPLVAETDETARALNRRVEIDCA